MADNTVITQLAQQLIAQAPQAEWDAAGVDRAIELATALASKGVTDLSQISTVQDANGNTMLKFGDVTLGGIGDIASGSEYGRMVDYQDEENFWKQKWQPNEGLWKEGKGFNPDQGGLGELGWSSAGHGNVGYTVKQGPDGMLQIAPEWGSSSEADMWGMPLAMLATPFVAGALTGELGGISAGGSGGGAAFGAAGMDPAAIGLDYAAANPTWASSVGFSVPEVATAIQQAAPIIESKITSLGPAATTEDLIAAIADGASIPASQVASIIKAAGGTVLSGLKSLLGPSASGWLDSLLGNLPAAIGGGIQIAGGLDAIGDFKDIVNQGSQGIKDTGADQAAAIRNQGTNYAGDLRDWGTGTKDKYDLYGQGLMQGRQDLGTGLRTGWENFGDTAANRVTDFGTTAKDRWDTQSTATTKAFTDLGTTGSNAWNTVGTNAKTMFGDIAKYSTDEFGKLSTNYGDKFGTAAGDVYGKATGLANDILGRGSSLGKEAAGMVGDFTPFALTTNLGSTDSAGNFKLNSQMQGVNDAATLASQKSFDAVNEFNLGDIRNQEYGLMKALWAPDDEAARTANEARQIAQGRGGLQSFSAANSLEFTDPNTGSKYTVGANPADVALMKAQQNRDLQGYLTADDNAMKRRAGLIDQGNAAMTTPLAFGEAGRNLIATGGQLGKYKSDVEASRAGLFANLAGQGLGAYGQIASSGINAYGEITREGLRTSAGLDEAGVTGAINAKTSGVNADILAQGKGVDFANQTGLEGTRQGLQDTRTGLGMLDTTGRDAVDLRNAADKTGLTADQNQQIVGQGLLEGATDKGMAATTQANRDAIDAQNKAEELANNADFKARFDALKVKMGGEERALNMTVRMYEALGNSISKLGNTGSPQTKAADAVNQIVQQTGMSINDVWDMIERFSGSVTNDWQNTPDWTQGDINY